MKKGDVKAVLGRVLLWPAEAQKEAVASLRAIEAEWTGEDYRATPQELQAIDEADCGAVASDDEVEATLRSFRSALRSNARSGPARAECEKRSI